MAPYTPPFPSHEIPAQAQQTAKGKRNKDLPKDFDLKRDCRLQQLWQYHCAGDEAPGKPIVCIPIQRLFRRCENGMLVETTQWEGERKDVRFVDDGK